MVEAVTHHSAADWRPLIAQAAAVVWPGLHDGPRLIEAQVETESNGDPRVVSDHGAVGLLQLMPGTAAEMGVTDPTDPAQSLHAGIGYLKRQYDALRAVPTHSDRLRWSWAAYNCGRGYVSRALALAEMDKSRSLTWWAWDSAWRYLFHRDGAVRGRWADYHQAVDYVIRIESRYRALGGAPL